MADYWEERFRESDERAALLNEANARELVELYHASEQDFDLSSMCFEALQRRPHGEVFAEAEREGGARTATRRRFAASLYSLSTRSSKDRERTLP